MFAVRRLIFFGIMILASAGAAAPVGARADDGFGVKGQALTQQERRNLRANILRQQSKDRALSQLGYETLGSDQTFQRSIDFFALGEQIRRLGALIQEISVAPVASQVSVPEDAAALLPVMPEANAPVDVRAVYGPDGPTAKSVRLILEYRLTVNGNPRLKVGDVDTGDKVITASIVTRDGSLVEQYAINRETGVWEPVRN